MTAVHAYRTIEQREHNAPAAWNAVLHVKHFRFSFVQPLMLTLIEGPSSASVRHQYMVPAGTNISKTGLANDGNC